jgi:hypothetical protein
MQIEGIRTVGADYAERCEHAPPTEIEETRRWARGRYRPVFVTPDGAICVGQKCEHFVPFKCKAFCARLCRNLSRRGRG